MEIFDLSRFNLAFILLAVFTINACSVAQPFVDRRREAGAQTEAALYRGVSTPENPAICYNKLTTDYNTVFKLAEAECRKYKTGRYAVPVKQTSFTCRLLIPNHFYFKCVN